MTLKSTRKAEGFGSAPAFCLLLLFLSIVSGCTTIGNALNPYKSDFNCPLSDKGQCIGLPQAYDQSVKTNPEGMKEVPKKEAEGSNGTGNDRPDQPVSAETTYEKASYQKLAGLLREPVTPLVAPPKVMRVLLLPYKSGENDLYMLRYAYFFVDDPKWVFGNYLAMEGE
jgi:conjugal transfer pilus assembly protein TraV